MAIKIQASKICSLICVTVAVGLNLNYNCLFYMVASCCWLTLRFHHSLSGFLITCWFISVQWLLWLDNWLGKKHRYPNLLCIPSAHHKAQTFSVFFLLITRPISLHVALSSVHPQQIALQPLSSYTSEVSFTPRFRVFPSSSIQWRITPLHLFTNSKK